MDTNLGICRLPSDRFTWFNFVLKNKNQPYVILQVLLGHLNFICRVVVPEMAFCVYLSVVTSKLLTPHHFICITVGLKESVEADISHILKLHPSGAALFA